MTCCGEPMARHGDQYVCGKCGSWFQGSYSGGAR